MKKKTIDKLRDEFVGVNKVQPLRIEKQPDGTYKFTYKSDGVQSYIECESRRELDDVFIEFGGKNTDTVQAPDTMLSLGDWRAEDLFEMGHRITKISVSGQRMVSSTKSPIDIGKECGSSGIINAKNSKKNDGLSIVKLSSFREGATATVSFSNDEEVDNFIDRLTTNEAFEGFKWTVTSLNTYALDEKRSIVWNRTKAGDGTSRMVMELTKLDGIHYHNCVHYDIIAAADAMAAGECKKIPGKRKQQKDGLVCEIYAASLPEPQ